MVTLQGTGRQPMELRVPIGAEAIMDPRTNVRYTARWQADESGRLQLYQVDIAEGQVNVPPSAQPLHISANIVRANQRGGGASAVSGQ